MNRLGKESQYMTYVPLIVIFNAFAKKNEDKIAIEKRKGISTVMPLLSFYIEGNDV